MKAFDIIPEFSFVVGNPADPERDTRETLQFIRKIKRSDPSQKSSFITIRLSHNVGVCTGRSTGRSSFPTTPEEWASGAGWTSRYGSIPTHPG